MIYSYAVTFEFETRPPLTHRGTVSAGAEHTGASRAIKEARRVLRPINWTSMVCLLLDRAPEASGERDDEVEESDVD